MTKETKIIHSKDLPEVWNEEVAVRDSLNWLLVFRDKVPGEMNLKINLAHRGARAEVAVIFLGKEKNETIMRIAVMHEAPDTFGRVSVKAALSGESRFKFHGMLDIGPGASGADSYLSAKGLLLSSGARAEIYPHLEIKTDEVRASHGSSVGRMDEGQLFYLQSRGLNRDDAQKIALRNFFGEYAHYC